MPGPPKLLPSQIAFISATYSSPRTCCSAIGAMVDLNHVADAPARHGYLVADFDKYGARHAGTDVDNPAASLSTSKFAAIEYDSFIAG